MELVYDKILSFLENRFMNFSKKYPDLNVLIKERKIEINSIYIDDYPLIMHLRKHDINMTTYLLKYGLDANLKPEYNCNWAVLYASIIHDDIKSAKLFLEYDASTNIRIDLLEIAIEYNKLSDIKQKFEKVVRDIALLNVLT